MVITRSRGSRAPGLNQFCGCRRRGDAGTVRAVGPMMMQRCGRYTAVRLGTTTDRYEAASRYTTDAMMMMMVRWLVGKCCCSGGGDDCALMEQF